MKNLNKSQNQLNSLKAKFERLLEEAYDILDMDIIDDVENYDEVLDLKYMLDDLIQATYETNMEEIKYEEDNEEIEAWREDGMA